MKQLFTFALATVLTLCLGACSTTDTTTNDTKSTASSTGTSEQWPTSEIKIIQPWSLGGGPDVITRQIASYSEQYLGVPMIVENHTGGSGTIGMNDFLAAPDDGNTLFCSNGPLFSLTPHFITTNYSIKDIAPLVGIRITEFVVLTNATSGIKDIDQLKAYAKSGHTIKYATTGGPGNDSYTMISALFAKLGIASEPVPYDGGQEAINALVGGHVDVAIGSPPTYRDYVKQGQLNVLGTFIPNGLDVEGIGHIPSFKDQGIDVEFTGMDYFAVRSTVDPEKQKILKDFVLKVYADPDFKAFMTKMGMEAWQADAPDILSMIDTQTKKMEQYIPLIK